MKENKVSEIISVIIYILMLCLWVFGPIWFFANWEDITDLRKERAQVVEVDGNYYVVETKDGNLWSFYDEDYNLFLYDTILVHFDTNGTDDIYDDEISHVTRRGG